MALNKGDDNTAIKAEHSATAKSCVLARDATIADVRDNVGRCSPRLLIGPRCGVVHLNSGCAVEMTYTLARCHHHGRAMVIERNVGGQTCATCSVGSFRLWELCGH